MSATDVLASLAGPIEEKLDEAREVLAERERVTHDAREAEKDAREDVRTLEALMKRIKGEPVHKRKNGKGKLKSVAQESKDEVMAVIANHPEGVTAAEIMEATGRSNSNVRDTVAVLRSEERVRLAGVRPREEGSPGRGSQTYVALDG